MADWTSPNAARCGVAWSSRESLPKEGMIRFVLDPGRVVVPDLAGKLPGGECGCRPRPMC